MDSLRLFDEVYVINLRRRPDRLAAFWSRLEEQEWPFARPRIFSAIDGSQVSCTPEFTCGAGAFGCRESHVAILRDCLRRGVQSLLILEDDAELLSGFVDRCARFMYALPVDWQGIMLGGQHLAPPEAIVPGVVRVLNGHRTHAYGCRGEYLAALYERWVHATVHIDWLMTDWQQRYRVYAPDPWLIGQAGASSDINGRFNGSKAWLEPTGNEPVVHLTAPCAVADELRHWGWHFGQRRDPRTGYDRGLTEIFKLFENGDSEELRRLKLAAWLQMAQRDTLNSAARVTAVWHPDCSRELLWETTRGPIIEIAAETADEALTRLPGELRGARAVHSSDRAVILLRAPRDVLEKLRPSGFHAGHQRGADGVCIGLSEIYIGPEAERAERLVEWILRLRGEAREFASGIVTVWYPRATRDEIAAATDLPVWEFAANHAAEALEQFECSLKKKEKHSFNQQL